MGYRSLLATAALAGLVPAVVGVAYAGHLAGLYPFAAIPAVFGVVFAAALVVLFAVLRRDRPRGE